MSKYKILSGADLKHIAMVSMLIDHVNKGILFQRAESPALVALSDLFFILGRIAFPIFCFLLVEGFFHTRSKAEYLCNLLMFAVISEVPYDLFSDVMWVNWGVQNIFFTLALALGVIWSIDEIRKRSSWWPLAAVMITLLGCVIGVLAGFTYDYYCVIVVVIFYLFHDKRLLGTALGALVMIKEYWSIPSFALLNLYNGKRGKQIKWLNYWFYPVHLLLLGLFRLVTNM